MTIGNVLTQKHAAHGEQPAILSVLPGDTVTELSGKLTSQNVGAMLVLDERGGLAGIVSERDVVRAIAHHGAASLTMTAGDLMTREVTTATPATTVAEALKLMSDGHFRHLPVLADGAVQGVVSIRDVLERRISESETEAEAMKSYVVRTY